MGDNRTDTEFSKSVNLDGLFFVDPDMPAFYNIEK